MHVPMNGRPDPPRKSPPMQLLQVVLRLTISSALLAVLENVPSAAFFQMPRSVGAVVKASVADSPLTKVIAVVVDWSRITSDWRHWLKYRRNT